MDYIFKTKGIFLVTVVLFIYNALKIQHSSNHFPTPKDDPEKKENDKQVRISEEIKFVIGVMTPYGNANKVLRRVGDHFIELRRNH